MVLEGVFVGGLGICCLFGPFFFAENTFIGGNDFGGLFLAILVHLIEKPSLNTTCIRHTSESPSNRNAAMCFVCFFNIFQLCRIPEESLDFLLTPSTFQGLQRISPESDRGLHGFRFRILDLCCFEFFFLWGLGFGRGKKTLRSVNRRQGT